MFRKKTESESGNRMPGYGKANRVPENGKIEHGYGKTVLLFYEKKVMIRGVAMVTSLLIMKPFSP